MYVLCCNIACFIVSPIWGLHLTGGAWTRGSPGAGRRRALQARRVSLCPRQPLAARPAVVCRRWGQGSARGGGWRRAQGPERTPCRRFGTDDGWRRLRLNGDPRSSKSSVSAKIEPNPILNRPLHTPMYVVRNLCASFFRVPRHL